uniref:Uncharacterized protein n=1 Tax=Nelumbo nucifera TaxID=4432 RepID=A0A822YBV3_NELNU|nr:TPA_asm: hypothetical protein HUJ06_029953 [Nelumbo nucifera]
MPSKSPSLSLKSNEFINHVPHSVFAFVEMNVEHLQTPFLQNQAIVIERRIVLCKLAATTRSCSL